ncbi:MAG TPA: DNA topoisomerase I, partial [Alicyclobacillus sp.]|nr:DNA topoisomerase I [Alicyclobacillus sp.]
ERRAKRGRIFYGCKNYPSCDFVLWDRPTGEKCPRCGSLLVLRKAKDKETVQCSNPQCDFKGNALEKAEKGNSAGRRSAVETM